MKRITVTVPDEVCRAAELRAAHLGRSVEGLVLEFLEGFTREDGEFARLEALQRRMHAEVTGFHAGDRLSREQLHERGIS